MLVPTKNNDACSASSLRTKLPTLLGTLLLGTLLVTTTLSPQSADRRLRRLQEEWNPAPFSDLSPVSDLGMGEVQLTSRTPNVVATSSGVVPTNRWYQNLLLGDGKEVYAMPYMIDVKGELPGIKVIPNYVGGNSKNVVLLFDPNHGLTLGATGGSNQDYAVTSMSDFGLTLAWVSFHCIGFFTF